MSRLNFLLLVIVVMCALSVVNATNRQRELFISLGRAQMQERQGQQELAQLQYQQSSLSKTSRVEDTSTSELKMESVTAGRTQYLTVAGASAAAAGDSTNPAGANASGASGASAADPSATTLGSGTMPTASAGDDSSNAATSSDLRAVIGASAPARAAKPAASAALAASAPVKTTEKKAGKHAPAKPTKAANPSSVKHATKSTGANGVSK